MTAIALKSVLASARIPAGRLAHALGYSPGTVSDALNHGRIPKRTPFRAEVEAYLNREGIPGDGIWEEAATSPQIDRLEPALQNNDRDDTVEEKVMLAQATLKHFRLFRSPFDEPRSAEDVFVSGDVRFILEAMRATVSNQGILAVIGDSGAGKTVVRRLMMSQMSEDPDVSIIRPRILDKERISASSLCDAVIADTSDEHPRRSPEAKARQVEKILVASARAERRSVMVIEEAHDLTVAALRYLKRFWELEDEAGFGGLVGIVLIGQTELRNKLDERRHPEAREFIRRCLQVELEPLGGQLGAYLAFRFERAGSDIERVFSAGTVAATQKRLERAARHAARPQSVAYPLMVHNLVARAMNAAANLGEPLVTPEIVREVQR